ncbi:MAG: phytanoyl-CoA dioxygenase family protein [Pseudomonadota bacterium]
MLTDQEIEAFYTVGWLLKPELFNAAEVDAMRACFSNLERLASDMPRAGLREGSQFVLGERGGAQVIERVVWAGSSQPYLLEIGSDARLTVPAAQLLGSLAVDQLLSQAHFKRPHDGVVFGWHQDIRHRDKGGDTWRDANGRGSFVQAIIVLDAMTPDSGPLQFIAGSSRWGQVDFTEHDYNDPNCTLRRGLSMVVSWRAPGRLTPTPSTPPPSPSQARRRLSCTVLCSHPSAPGRLQLFQRRTLLLPAADGLGPSASRRRQCWQTCPLSTGPGTNPVDPAQ